MIINGIDYPERPMSSEEGEAIFGNMLSQIQQYNPDEIIAVMRSGAALGMWVAQQLKLPLGAYWHERDTLIKLPESKRLVFVDDNIVMGTTLAKCREFCVDKDFEYKWAVFTSDEFATPADIRASIIQGSELDYYVTGPLWGQRKIPQGYNKPFRGEQ